MKICRPSSGMKSGMICSCRWLWRWRRRNRCSRWPIFSSSTWPWPTCRSCSFAPRPASSGTSQTPGSLAPSRAESSSTYRSVSYVSITNSWKWIKSYIQQQTWVVLEVLSTSTYLSTKYSTWKEYLSPKYSESTWRVLKYQKMYKCLRISSTKYQVH